jgi:predicted ArsR family transcriptional regulator
MATGYDDLALSALRFLQDVGGEDAVRHFAERRFTEIEERARPVVEAAGPDPRHRAAALAGALSVDGYAASTRTLQVAGHPVGTQLCQGHCPVQHVARAFPQLCEAEARMFSRLLGVHVQRLATLAHGEHVCTTHVPHAPTAAPAVAGSSTTSSRTAAGRTAMNRTTSSHVEKRQPE